MKINKHSINGLLQLTLIFCIFMGVGNSILIQAQEPTKTETGDQNLKPDGEDTNLEDIKKQLTKIENDINDLNNSFSDKIDESLNKQNYFSLLDSLLYIDLPIAAILLLLWFLSQNQQQKKADRLNAKQDTIEKRLRELKENNLTRKDIENIERKIIKQFQDNNQKITDSKIEILGTLQKNQTHQPGNSHEDIGNYSNNYHSFSTSTTEQAEHQLDTHSYTPVAVADPIPQFVDKYNQDKQSLSNEAVAKVSATEASLHKRRAGSESKLILENTIQKRYLIIQEDGDYFLVPHAKIKINEHNKSSLEALFECVSFIPEYTDFHLIKPAKVSQVEPELWQLDSRGKIEFS